jgi:hypothetical protein
MEFILKKKYLSGCKCMAEINTTFPAVTAVLPLAVDWCCICKLNKMDTLQEKIQCCFQYASTESVKIMQR